MKDQYFGDVHDFRKYALLRSLTMDGGLRLGVCWMLTEPDDRPDGESRAYLEKSDGLDPELFSWLKANIRPRPDRKTSLIERSGQLGSAVFQNNIPANGEFDSCDLVFFDPDNGLEVQSVPRGRKRSNKYLYWDDVQRSFTSGSSILIYQHFNRQKRDGFIFRLASELKTRTGAAQVFYFRTPRVVFLLASQARHAEGFRQRLADCQRAWRKGGISGHIHP